MLVQEIVGFSCVGHSGRIISHPAIQNDSGAMLAAGMTRFPNDSWSVRFWLPLKFGHLPPIRATMSNISRHALRVYICSREQHACSAPSRCTGTTHRGDTRCRVRACGNESGARSAGVTHLHFTPSLSERKRYEKRQAARDDSAVELQHRLRAWFSRQP